MAIQPIDLQALFTQMDKVGKTQSFLKTNQEVQQALQSAETQKRTEEKIRSVNETQDAGEGAERIKDRKSGNQRQSAYSRQGEPEEQRSEDDDAKETVRDPELGKNVDISG